MTTRILAGLLCIIVTVPAVVTAQESEDAVAIRQCFHEYLQANWERRRELMSDEAWMTYTMATIYAHKQLAEAEINRHGLQDYRLSELPSDYHRLPHENAINNARMIMKTAYDELSSKLGNKFVAVIQRIADTTSQPTGNPMLHNIKILADKVTATAECQADGVHVLVPMRFKMDGDKWRFDGKNELLFFDRLR